MLKLSDLTLRPDFQLGPVLVSPSRRLVEGPGGRANFQPLIMQVFLMLLDAGGQVVSRNDLFDQCWGGTYVGEDSLNRAVAKVRQVAAEVAPGLLEIETIPRTGYRIRGQLFTPECLPRESGERSPFELSRRGMLGSAAALGIAGAGGFGAWWMRHSRGERRFIELMNLGNEAQLYGDHSNEAAKYYDQAVAMRPDSPKAQGLLAFSQAMVAEDGGPQAGGAVQRADRAARVALAADPKEANARLALVTLQRSTLDLATNEDRLREILQIAPDNISAMDSLWSLLQSVGRSQDALSLVGRANAIAPYAANIQFPMAQLLWIVGRNAEADRVIDRAMQYWPTHQYVRFARYTIYAYTGRPRAALAMLDDENGMSFYTPAAIALWRVSLAALDKRSIASTAAARSANVEAAKRNPQLTSQAVLVLSALGEIDAAFEIANQLLLFRSPSEPSSHAKSTSWRFAPWLFTPPAEPMQADPRFSALCDGIGLTEYWRKRSVIPDFALRRR
jgi:DNA-binding winged helix-turn-helix (wHTH) protein/tetratricopeptide (TPR) repeat protein